MSDQINIMLGDIKYLSHNVNEALVENFEPKDVNTFIRVRIEMKHDKNQGHFIDIFVEQGFDTKKDQTKVLTVESTTQFLIAPYDNVFFKKPAKVELVRMMTVLTEKACDHNRGMFVIISEDYGRKEARFRPLSEQETKNLIFNDVNKHLLS